jgi:hypothetical protein
MLLAFGGGRSVNGNVRDNGGIARHAAAAAAQSSSSVKL